MDCFLMAYKMNMAHMQMIGTQYLVIGATREASYANNQPDWMYLPSLSYASLFTKQLQ